MLFLFSAPSGLQGDEQPGRRRVFSARLGPGLWLDPPVSFQMDGTGQVLAYSASAPLETPPATDHLNFEFFKWEIRRGILGDGNTVSRRSYRTT
jgi:hypothetical protein